MSSSECIDLRICSSRSAAARWRSSYCSSTERPSGVSAASSVAPIAAPYRVSIFSRTDSKVGRHYDGTAAGRFNPACRLVYLDQALSELPLATSILDYVVEADGVTERQAIRLLAQAASPSSGSASGSAC